MTTSLAARLLPWYRANARQLPWRGHPDPYAIWVSEIMLQQTRVETVTPYFERWMARFPTVEALAEASQQEVLGMWEGLGYYSRARNLHQAAQIVVEKYSGELPRDADLLHGLPGIGRYTVGAIASIAFGMDEPTLDGNIRRVLARVFDVREPARSSTGEKMLWKLASENLTPGQAGAYNQALMELGATICTSRRPKCEQCPLDDMCTAYSLSVQAERPVKTLKPEIPHHIVTAAVIQRDGQVLIAKRPPEGLLGGMWEFPGGKVQPGEGLVACLNREIREELSVEIKVGRELGIYKNAYTHFRVTLHAFYCGMNGGKPRNLHHTALAWADPDALVEYPMGKIDRQIANDLCKLQGNSHADR